MLALGFASYLSVYPVLLFPPLILLCFDRHIRRTKGEMGAFPFALKLTLIFVMSVVTLLVASYFITGMSWEFIAATYGVQLLVPDLTPNTGLWWYFLIEIFDPFREFFIGVFWLHLAGYVGGLTIRLRRQPLFVITALLGLFALFKPYPSISDVSIFIALLPLYRHVFPRKFTPDSRLSSPPANRQQLCDIPSLQYLRSSMLVSWAQYSTISGFMQVPETPTSSMPSPSFGVWASRSSSQTRSLQSCATSGRMSGRK